jgi:hypothetical protein
MPRILANSSGFRSFGNVFESIFILVVKGLALAKK